MPGYKAMFLAIATAWVAPVHADYMIDPSSVSLTTRKSWCSSEISTCPLICETQSDTGARVNTCDPNSLTYGCLCNDGTTPNVSEYSLTLPYFVCTQWGSQCVTACGQDNSCASACREDHPCGALNPTTINSTNLTATAHSGTASSTPADATTVYTGYSGESGTSSNAFKPPALDIASLYAVTGVLGMFGMGFAYLL